MKAALYRLFPCCAYIDGYTGPEGSIGPTGTAGAGIEILGSYDTLAGLIAEHPTGVPGEVYAVNGVLYYWDDGLGEWRPIENLHGPTGPTGPEGSIGPTGPAGAGIEILGSYDTLAGLIAEHPTGVPGEVYAVNGVLYYWDDEAGEWRPIENLHGPTGPTGPTI